MIGGGSGMARPGAISKAHRGVLFLDECAEIGTSALEALRTPLEEGEIRLARRDGVAVYPARFQLVLAANPCPCAPADPQDCVCPGAVKRRYLGKLSGPLLDRIDLHIEMYRVRKGALNAEAGESTRTVRDRVIRARAIAAERWRPYGVRTNAEVSGAILRQHFDSTPRPWHRFATPWTKACSVSEASIGRCASRGRLPISAAVNGRVSRMWPPPWDFAGWERRDDRRPPGVGLPFGVVEPPCPELNSLVHRVGPDEAADRVRRGEVGAELARRTEARREQVCANDDLDRIDRAGGRLITPLDDEWPMIPFTSFAGVDLRRHPAGVAPLVLWAVGDVNVNEVALRAVAIVGTRAATDYGERVAADLAAGVCDRDVAVLSGGAFGIDGAAHRAALAEDGCTVAVLAGGADVSYPAGHSALLHRIDASA